MSAALWQQLAASGIVQGEPPQASARSSWPVRVMLGIAGWIGALCLLVFAGLAFESIFKNAGTALIVGVLVCAAATALFRAAPENDFASQFGFAVSLAGQALIIFGIASGTDGKSVAAVASATCMVQALLFWLVPNYLHRVWAAATSACAFALALTDMGLVAFAPGLLTAAFAWVSLKEFEFAKHGSLGRAAIYGLGLAVVVGALLHSGVWFSWLIDQPKMPVGGIWGTWIGSALTGLIMIWAVSVLLAREGLARDSAQARIAIIGAVVIALLNLKAPGIGPVVAVLVLGFANGNRVLAGLGILGMLVYLSHYYYSLQITLLEKSMLLACTGIALLGVRLALHRYWPAAEAKGVLHA